MSRSGKWGAAGVRAAFLGEALRRELRRVVTFVLIRHSRKRKNADKERKPGDGGGRGSRRRREARKSTIVSNFLNMSWAKPSETKKIYLVQV